MFVLSVLPLRPGRNQSLKRSSQALECQTHSPLLSLPPVEEFLGCATSPNCTGLCWLHQATYHFSWFFRGPQACKVYWFPQSSKWGEIETSSSGSSSKKQEHWRHAPLLPSPWGNSHILGHCLLALSCVGLLESSMQVKWNCSSYLLQCYCSCLGHCNFLTCFWHSHKGILVHIACWSQCFCG